ncbi:pyridoxal phosphate-dependent decarboxylase family protein [Aquimarina muelleri]|uniref:Decarboxylase n=1 Tax=Aquimarina muelleri TaxID=279356 RepID=A0A918N587_9FLAO|nr:aspartate aminotransferase family protein [Aquimarina muelleri]MCX2763252.1 aspartate aminotransferase family protein [Aquimarina muelleri]GGX27664.1 decarboxylase [Aquimarina muelleri]
MNNQVLLEAPDIDSLQELFDGDFYKDIFHENSEEEYSKAIQIARECISRFLKNNKTPFSGIKPADLLSVFKTIDFNTPLENYKSLFEEIETLYVNHATAFHLPNYIAHLNCPVVIPALAAEVLISAINSSQDTYDQSAGGTFMERKLIDWTANQIGFDSNCDGIFNAGGSQSNLMGLLLARDYYSLEHLKHNIKIDGNPPESSRFRIFVSEKSHFSNLKNASLMGLGEQAVIKVKTDSQFRMNLKSLERAITNEIELGNIPIAIIGTAGTTDFGNLDPLNDLGKIANHYNLWYHIDAAYGCGLLLTDTYRHLLNGIELADSVTVDYHKSFFQPISSSAFIVRNKYHLNIIKHHADYLNPNDQDYDELPAQINKSITQSTRRFDALKLWCTLRLLGKEKLGQYTEVIIDTAKKTALFLDTQDDFELLNHSDLGALVFRYLPKNEQNYDSCAMNQYIKKTLFFTGEVLIASTKVEDKFFLKFTILNPLTTINHTKNILKKIKNHGQEYLQSI